MPRVPALLSLPLLLLACSWRILADADQLNVPVAFPIFRPPLESVHRQKSSVENIRPPLRFHSLHNSHSTNLSALEVEEISAPSLDSFSSAEEEEEADDSSHSGQQRNPQHEEVLGTAHFSSTAKPMPGAVSVQAGKGNNASVSESSSEFVARSNGTKAKTKGPMKMNKLAGGTDEFPFATTQGALLDGQSSRRSSPQSPAVSVINTPQFPVFTGMGMEIIESHEGEEGAGGTTKGVVSNHGQKEEEERRKMHYQRAENGSKGDETTAVPIHLVHLSTLASSTKNPAAALVGETSTKRNELPSATTTEKASGTSEGPTRVPIALPSSTAFFPSQSNANQTTSGHFSQPPSSPSPASLPTTKAAKKGENIDEDTTGEAFKTEATAHLPALLSTTGVPNSADEVTEDLLAMLANNPSMQPSPSHSAASSPPPHPPPASAESIDQFHNIGLNGKDELDSGFERQTQIAEGEPGIPAQGSTTPARPDEATVLTRPTRPPSQQQFWTSTTELPASSNTSPSSRVFTRFPLLWTSSTQKALPKSASSPAKGPNPSPSNKLENNSLLVGGGGGFGQNWRPIEAETTTEAVPLLPTWGRIMPGGKKMATTTEWPMSNHLGEEEGDGRGQGEDHENGGIAGGEEENVGKEKGPVKAGNKQGQGERGSGEELEQGKRGKELSSKSSRYSTSHSAANSHLRVFITAAIILALLVIVAVGSVCTARYVKRSRQLHGKYRPAAYEMQTQQRYQPDFVQHPPVQQQQTAIFNGKDERLI